MDKSKYLIWRGSNIIAIVDLEKETIEPLYKADY